MLLRFLDNSDTQFWNNKVYCSGCWSSNYPFYVSHWGERGVCDVWGHIKFSILKGRYESCCKCWARDI